MSTTNNAPARGRPRRFDPEEAVATAQRLFHEKGYDAVSVADLTRALGINPPSFYAAFGSKNGLYARVLDRYAVAGAIPLREILAPDRQLAVALADLLAYAARTYAGDAGAPGCLVLEGKRCNDPEARDNAAIFHVAAQEVIRGAIAARHPRDADRIVDFVCTIMAGMSASARDGQDVERLLATARLAGVALAQSLPG